MTDAKSSQPPLLRVKRDGARGWRLIDAEAYNPDIHELLDAPEKPAPKKRGRKPKALTEKDNGNG